MQRKLTYKPGVHSRSEENLHNSFESLAVQIFAVNIVEDHVSESSHLLIPASCIYHFCWHAQPNTSSASSTSMLPSGEGNTWRSLRCIYLYCLTCVRGVLCPYVYVYPVSRFIIISSR